MEGKPQLPCGLAQICKKLALLFMVLEDGDMRDLRFLFYWIHACDACNIKTLWL